MAYTCDLGGGQHLYIDNIGDQTAVTLASGRPGQQQQSGSQFTTGAWTAPPELFRTEHGVVIKLSTNQGDQHLQFQAGQLGWMSSGHTLAHAQQMQTSQVAAMPKGTLPTMEPMQFSQPVSSQVSHAPGAQPSSTPSAAPGMQPMEPMLPMEPMRPMQPMQPMQMGNMTMNANPMEMRMGNMEMRMGTPPSRTSPDHASAASAAASTASANSSASSGSASKFCSQCGSPVQPSDRFCANCGHPLGT